MYERDITESIKKIAGTWGKDYVQIILAEIVSVDESERTCIVTQVTGESETEIPDVNLLAESNDGFLRIPKVGSNVIIAVTDNNSPFVLMFSECDKIYSIQDEFQFNDGAYGGLVKVNNLTEKINNLEEKLNTILDTLKSVVIPLAPSGTYGLIADFGDILPLTETDKSELENDKITHG
jgi:hypothetical protein